MSMPDATLQGASGIGHKQDKSRTIAPQIDLGQGRISELDWLLHFPLQNRLIDSRVSSWAGW